ncbi:MAG: hypothetical protein K2H42_03110, partial [Alistipes sp.]|nr:hypothetical protein [Alistipes sp.]
KKIARREGTFVGSDTRKVDRTEVRPNQIPAACIESKRQKIEREKEKMFRRSIIRPLFIIFV